MNKLKERARYCLLAMPDYGFLTGEFDHSGLETRFRMMDADSVVLDLIQCIEFTSNKREKRMRRMSFLARVLNISEYVQQKVVYIQEQYMGQIVKQNGNQHMSTLDELLIQQQRNSSIFKRNDIRTVFKQPIVQQFHNQCKDILNVDGHIYDIFTCVVIIAFYELVIGCNNASALQKCLLSTATLQFKGGAAVGKFLLKSNHQLWNSFSEEDKQFAISNFIQGGDNDTSINFHYEPNANHYLGKINEEIGSIMFDLSTIMIKIASDFHIEDLMYEQVELVKKSTFEFDKCQFTFEPRKTLSFAVVDLENDQMECIPMIDKRSCLFNSISYLEFLNQNRQIVKFYLTRMKYGFKACNPNVDIDVNCYAECLDVSGCCIDSAYVFASTYMDVNLSMFV